MRRRGSYPGLTRAVDRHGKVRWRFRMKGRPSCYIGGEYDTHEFRTAYERAVAGRPDPTDSLRAPEPGSFAWLISHYKQTPVWAKLGKASLRNLGNEVERFRDAHGTRMVAQLRTEHVEALLTRMADRPAAANRFLKLVRRLCRFAIRRRVITVDPTLTVKGFATNPDGFHTWTEGEVLRFVVHHGEGSKAVLALRLALYTGAARQDMAALGWQNVRSGRIAYRRHKTGGEVDIPIHPELAAALAGVPRDQLLFVTWGQGRGYKPETLGMWFHEACVAAGLPQCSLHGLRKLGATRLADAGATEFEVMAFLGHRTPDEARTYTKRASRAKLGDSGMAKLIAASNPVERLDNHRAKARKAKEK